MQHIWHISCTEYTSKQTNPNHHEGELYKRIEISHGQKEDSVLRYSSKTQKENRTQLKQQVPVR